MANKFKMGDKVRIIRLESEDKRIGLRIGDIGTVADDSSVPDVKFPGIEEAQPMVEDQIELCPVSKKISTPTFDENSMRKVFRKAFKASLDFATELKFQKEAVSASMTFGFTQGLVASGMTMEKANNLVLAWSNEIFDEIEEEQE